MYLLERFMSAYTRGHNPVPAAPPHISLCDGGSAASGSYAEYLTPGMSIFTIDGQAPRDVEWPGDVSQQATQRNVLAYNDARALSGGNDGNDHSRDVTRKKTVVGNVMRPPALPPNPPTPLSGGNDGSRNVTLTKTVDRNVMRPPALPPNHPTPLLLNCNVEQNTAQFSPITAQVPSIIFENDPPFAVSPPSPELQRLPMAPLPPCDACRTRPLPAEAEADVRQCCETQLLGVDWSRDTECGWGVSSGTAPRGSGGADHKATQVDKGPVGLDEGPVRPVEGPVWPDEGPVRCDEGIARHTWDFAVVFDRYHDPIYL